MREARPVSCRQASTPKAAIAVINSDNGLTHPVVALSKPRLIGADTEECGLDEQRRPAPRPGQDRGRRLNSSQVADAWISPLTNLQPPSASGGNMYVQRLHRTPGAGAGW